MNRYVLAWVGVLVLLPPMFAPPVYAEARVGADPSPDVWPSLVAEIFHGRAMAADDGVAILEAPVRADDAALVPITIRFAEAVPVNKATLVIDQNPAPVAAVFEIGDNSGVAFLETRVRVNSYTFVHVVTQTRDGTPHTASKFVKASGGCSAPANNSADGTNAIIGQIKYREFKTAAPGRREVQIMIRHPNNSGMQMDQLTHLYVPAYYIERVEVRQGADLIFSVQGGISLSANPTFRFDYVPNGARTISVVAHDSKGGTFKGEWPIAGAL